MKGIKQRAWRMGMVMAFMAVTTMMMLTPGCTSLRRPADGGPSAMEWRNGVKGVWLLTSIDKDNFPAEYAVKSLFEEAPPECFQESTWTLPFNGMGNIRFASEGRLCAPGAVRNIQWSIYYPGNDQGGMQFELKKIYPGDNPKNVLTVYRLDLAYADDKNMRMVMNVPLGGQSTGKLIFNFKNLQ
ncbi:MAG TPA: lipocalin family protein [Sphingobacteriaceae bacterium]|nr:lipocalin family protein [Sphingobacteriaceae bacterium]